MDGYPIPFHRIMPTAYAPALGAKAYDVPSAGLVPGGRPYMRDNTPIEMWIHTPVSAQQRHTPVADPQGLYYSVVLQHLCTSAYCLVAVWCAAPLCSS